MAVKALSAYATVTVQALSATGLTVTGTTTLSPTFNTSTGATSDVVQFLFQRGGVNKWRVGTNIDGTNADAFDIYNESGIVAVAISKSSSAVTIANGLTVSANGITVVAGTSTFGGPITQGVTSFRVGSSTAVSTSATTIYTVATLGMALLKVYGTDGVANVFVDEVYADGAGNFVVNETKNVVGSPAARTYSCSSTAVKLAMASGSYTIKVMAPTELA